MLRGGGAFKAEKERSEERTRYTMFCVVTLVVGVGFPFFHLVHLTEKKIILGKETPLEISRNEELLGGSASLDVSSDEINENTNSFTIIPTIKVSATQDIEREQEEMTVKPQSPASENEKEDEEAEIERLDEDIGTINHALAWFSRVELFLLCLPLPRSSPSPHP